MWSRLSQKNWSYTRVLTVHSALSSVCSYVLYNVPVQCSQPTNNLVENQILSLPVHSQTEQQSPSFINSLSLLFKHHSVLVGSDTQSQNNFVHSQSWRLQQGCPYETVYPWSVCRKMNRAVCNSFSLSAWPIRALVFCVTHYISVNDTHIPPNKSTAWILNLGWINNTKNLAHREEVGMVEGSHGTFMTQSAESFWNLWLWPCCAHAQMRSPFVYNLLAVYKHFILFNTL